MNINKKIPWSSEILMYEIELLCPSQRMGLSCLRLVWLFFHVNRLWLAFKRTDVVVDYALTTHSQPPSLHPEQRIVRTLCVHLHLEAPR